MLKLRHSAHLGFSGSLFYVLPISMSYLVVSKITNQFLCEDVIEKSVPRDHRLASLGKPRDDNR